MKFKLEGKLSPVNLKLKCFLLENVTVVTKRVC